MVGSAFNARAFCFFFCIQIFISLQRSPLVSISITAWQIVLSLFAHLSNSIQGRFLSLSFSRLAKMGSLPAPRPKKLSDHSAQPKSLE